MTAPAPLLEVRGLVKDYPGVRALDGVDLTVSAGQVHCVVGQNGAGKSTLIKCVTGLVVPTGGTISVEGHPLPPGDPGAALARGVAAIYQELDLVDDLTVVDNLFLGHELRRGLVLDRRAAHRRASELLQRLGHGDIAPRTLAGDLAPAAKQVVSVARALTRDARLLIMDEPSAVLGGDEIETMFGVVRRLTAAGVGVIYISHRLEEVAAIGDTITVLRDGHTAATGLPPATPRAELIAAMVGRPFTEMFPDRDGDRELGPAVLRVEHATRRPAVDDVSFAVHAGEIVGLAGMVGSGRTELLRLVAGLDARDAGTVTVDGRPLPAGRPDLAVRAGIGLAPEERKSQGLWPGWDLVRNVSVADLRRFRRRALLDRRAERVATAAQLRELGTTPADPERLVDELSGGNQQKVVLARWLLRRCRVLLLDEPTRGVDVGAKTEIYRVVRTLAASGKAVVMVSSELAELVGLCDRIVVMADGRVTAELAGPTATEADILAHALHPTGAAAP
ncbi:MAG TPA: sugar ABC transporter ATP-binding protein [Acidimicrobiales bacterium]|nr:sugar ABC transporter ATP-binding protein [Acidimicrobiales bacterium]